MNYTVVGGWANNRTLIRRKRQDLDITVEYTFNALRKDDPLKLLIEISTGIFNFLIITAHIKKKQFIFRFLM